jgi:TonB family protein
MQMSDARALFTQWFDAAHAALTNGDETTAAESLRAAIVVARSDPGLRPELASALFQLGKLCRRFGRAGEAEAEPLLTEALVVSERLFGGEHAALAPLLNELSRLHIHRSQYARAEKVLERLLAIARAKSEENAEVATALAGLAVVKRKLGDDASAEAQFRDALRIREKVLEPSHMVIVVTLEQLSETCASRGNFAEALALLRRGLAIREVALGPGHATVQVARSRADELELQVAAAAINSKKLVRANLPALARTKPTLVHVCAGVAAVAIAGLLMLRLRAGGARDPASDEMMVTHGTAGGRVVIAPSTRSGSTATGAAARVGATRADSRLSVNATAASIAQAGRAEQRAPESASPELRLPRVEVDVRPVDMPSMSVPTISAAPSVDSFVRSAMERQRLSDVALTETRARVSASTAPNVDKAGVDTGITPPKIIGVAPAPRFPEAVLRSGQREGQVVVRFMVNELGSVDVASMVVQQSDHELFTAAVRDILPRFRFEPAHTRAPESKQVPAWVTVPFRFTTKK